jgi:hypothetical protein
MRQIKLIYRPKDRTFDSMVAGRLMAVPSAAELNSVFAELTKISACADCMPAARRYACAASFAGANRGVSTYVAGSEGEV